MKLNWEGSARIVSLIMKLESKDVSFYVVTVLMT